MHKLKLFSSHLSIIPDNKRLNKQDNKNIPKLVLGRNTHKKDVPGVDVGDSRYKDAPRMV